MTLFRSLAGLRHVHFVGIGGAGMSGIAEILLDYDLVVSGSDLQRSEATERLVELGAVVSIGHRPENVAGADLVVISSAVQEDNPEVAAALDAGITVVRRAEMLGELMRLKYGIAVAGTHGKTTTTSLVGTLLTDAGFDPTVLVGGRLRVTGTGARHGKSDYLVAEADEYDRSFLRLMPIIAVITNVDTDHLDTYRDLEDIQGAFANFAGRVPFFGQVILCLDDPNVQPLLGPLADRRVVTYGLGPQAELQAFDLEPGPAGTRFSVRHVRSGELGRVVLPVPGEHNVQNALAAIAVGLALSLEFPAMAASLEQFRGVHRRFERLGSFAGAEVIDDYAHHPTEVMATLRAARQVFPRGQRHVIFQPHLYSRTRDQAQEFGRALLLADRVLVTDIYPSREQPIPGVSAQLVVDAAKRSGHRSAEYCATLEATAERLRREVKAGDAILTLGAGDINRFAERLVAGAARRESA